MFNMMFGNVKADVLADKDRPSGAVISAARSVDRHGRALRRPDQR
jgi:hypothetical protein